jgi:hypothetical protein
MHQTPVTEHLQMRASTTRSNNGWKMVGGLILAGAFVWAAPPGAAAGGLQEGGASRHGESTLPEEALLERMQSGDLAGAREGFKALLDKKLERLGKARATPPRNVEELAHQAAVLEGTVRTIRFWQMAEVEERLKGGQTPERELGEISAALGEVKTHADAVERSTKSLLTPEAKTRGPGKDIHSAMERTGKVFLLSVSFFRDTSQAGRRNDLLNEAKRYVPAPNTLTEFDAKNRGDLKKEFGIHDAPQGNPGDKRNGK